MSWMFIQVSLTQGREEGLAVWHQMQKVWMHE